MMVLGTEQFYLDDKKVPPRHPLQRLKRLVEFSHEMLDQWFINVASKDAWKGKFERNAGRMKRAFDRVKAQSDSKACGFFDPSLLHGGPHPNRKRREIPQLQLDYDYSDDYDYSAFDMGEDFDRYDRTDPCVGSRQLTTGFRKWAQRYINQCNGQRVYQYQIQRMHRWRTRLQSHMHCPLLH